MRQDSWKKSLKMGIISGAISFGMYLLLVLGAGVLTKWQTFFQPDMSLQKIGILSWEIIAAAGVILLSLVPVITLRYEKTKYVFLYLFVSILAFIWLYGMTLAIWMTVNSAGCPLTTLDALYYLMAAIPIGSMTGTVVAVGIHFLNKD